jgi:hypothetical protein
MIQSRIYVKQKVFNEMEKNNDHNPTLWLGEVKSIVKYIYTNELRLLSDFEVRQSWHIDRQMMSCLSLSPSSFLWDYFFLPSLSLSVGRMTTIIINALFFYIVEKAMKEITSMILVDTVPLRLSSSLSSVCAIALIHSGDNNSSRHNSRADNNR